MVTSGPAPKRAKHTGNHAPNPARRSGLSGSTFADRRGTPGGPPRVGQVATLSVRAERPGPPAGWRYETLSVRITAADGVAFRGVVIGSAGASGPLAPGHELTFDGWHVIALADAEPLAAPVP